MLKAARIFGESEPHVQTKGVPFEQNKRMYQRYLELKSKEEQSSPGGSAAVGGILGGLAGGALGGAKKGLPGALLGGGLGALGGASLGLLAMAHDSGKIQHAKRTLRAGGSSVDDALIHVMRAQEVHAEAMKDLQGQLRQHAIESASQGRHEELLDALKKHKKESPSDSLPRHAPTTSAMTEKTCQYCETVNPGTRSNCKNCAAPLPSAQLLGKMASAYDAALMEKEALTLPSPTAVREGIEQGVTTLKNLVVRPPAPRVQPPHMSVPVGAPQRVATAKGALLKSKAPELAAAGAREGVGVKYVTSPGYTTPGTAPKKLSLYGQGVAREAAAGPRLVRPPGQVAGAAPSSYTTPVG